MSNEELHTTEDITRHRRTDANLLERTQIAEFAAAIGQAFTQRTTLAVHLQICAQALVTHLGAAFGRIWTLNEQEQVLELQASAGLYTHLNGEHSRVPMGALKIGQIAQTRQPHLTNAVVGDLLVHNQGWARQEGMVAFAGYPLLVGDRVLGVMAMFARHPLSDVVLYAMATSASSIALSIERLRNQEALATSEERLRLWIEEASDVLTILSSTGTILYQSPSSERILGWTAQECQGSNLLQESWIHPQDRQQMETFLDALAHRPAESTTTIVRLKQKGGAWLPMELRGRNLVDHPLIHGLVVLGRDVSERLELDRQREAFFSMISHELRTPIASMEGNLQLIERRLSRLLQPPQALTPVGQPIVEETMLLTQRTLRQVYLQNRLTQDLLDVASIQTRKLDLQLDTCNLDILVHETVENLRAGAPERSLELVETAGPPSIALADPQRIGQVLTNYITNALKYSAATAPIIVGLSKEGEWARIWVRDQGPGLSAEQQQRIWERFYQVPGTSKQVGFGLGLGLGLHICQVLIKAHGGEVGVKSSPGEGATFWFTLPLLADSPPISIKHSTGEKI